MARARRGAVRVVAGCGVRGAPPPVPVRFLVPRFVAPRLAVAFLAAVFFAPRVPRPAPRFLAAMCYLPPRGPGAGGAAAGAGVVGVPAAGVGAFLSAALPAAVWPRNSRVGANSPSLWPTMFSVT